MIDWKQLVCNVDGRLSRTQVTLVILFVYTLFLTLLEDILQYWNYHVLTLPVGITLFLLFIFAFIDRLNASRLNVQFNKSGIQIEADKKNGTG